MFLGPILIYEKSQHQTKLGADYSLDDEEDPDIEQKKTGTGLFKKREKYSILYLKI